MNIHSQLLCGDTKGKIQLSSILQNIPHSVCSGEHIESHVKSKPTGPLVFRVAVTRSLVAREDIVQRAVRQDTTLRGTDDHQSLLGGIDPVC